MEYHARTGGSANWGELRGPALPEPWARVREQRARGHAPAWQNIRSEVAFGNQEFKAKDLLSVLNFSQKQTPGLGGRRWVKREGAEKEGSQVAR